MAEPRLAKSLEKLRSEIDAFAPKRDTSSDGWIASAAHRLQNPKSKHNEDDNGVVHAVDITHDPAHGVDTYKLADQIVAMKSKRLRLVISNGRIAGNASYAKDNNKPIWQYTPYTATNKHDLHGHFESELDPELADDDSPWGLKATGPVSDIPSSSLPTIKLGSNGTAVMQLQRLLELDPDGDFGVATDRTVRVFQRSRDIVADGIVGPYTWRALNELPATPLLPPALQEAVIKLAAQSSIASYSWKDRGLAPIGYTKGMACAYAYVYSKRTDPAVVRMSRPNTGDDATDALSWLNSMFVGMDNDNLRRLFVLMIGLGMRESSGKYCEGRDMSATNTTSDTAEAGMFQTSFNAATADPLMRTTFNAYSKDPRGFLSVYREDVQCSAASWESFGDGDGLHYQQLSKVCPAFHVEFTGLGLRSIRKHWGPVNRREVEIRPEADELFKQVQQLVDATPVPPEPPQPDLELERRVKEFMADIEPIARKHLSLVPVNTEMEKVLAALRQLLGR